VAIEISDLVSAREEIARRARSRITAPARSAEDRFRALVENAAEGIENEEDRRLVEEHRCDGMQG